MEDLFTQRTGVRSRGAKRDCQARSRLFSHYLSRYFDRLQRFETEKELVKVTIRKKDEEANRFTRHGKEWNLLQWVSSDHLRESMAQSNVEEADLIFKRFRNSLLLNTNWHRPLSISEAPLTKLNSH
jgi:hypothetical protein